VLKEEGIRALFFRVLGETVYRRAIVVEFSPSESIPTFQSRVPVRVELLPARQVDEYVRFRPEADHAVIRSRLEDGQWCFVAWNSGRIASASWVTTHRTSIHYLARQVDLSPGEAYVYEIFTQPELRRANIASVVASEVARHLQNAGYRRVWEIIVPENKSGLRLAAKTGFRRCGTMGKLKFGPWKYEFVRWDRRTRPAQYGAGGEYWAEVLHGLELRGHYLDTLLAELKRRTYLALIARWGGSPASGYVLKTDLFEEATGSDAFLADLRLQDNRVVGIDIARAVVDRPDHEMSSPKRTQDLRSIGSPPM
jgi:GNAT superfamily N-acetyltransferase